METATIVIGVISIIAIFAGPIAAVFVSNHVDKQRRERDRKQQVFKSMIANRRTPLHPDHVSAFNLVPVEFHGVEAVIDAFNALFAHLDQRPPRRDEETITDQMDAEAAKKAEDAYWTRVNQRTGDLQTKLLVTMAKHLGYQMEQLEVLRGGYFPEGHEKLELDQQAIRSFVIDLAEGRRAVPIRMTSPD